MLNLCRVTKVKVFFLALVYVFNSDLFEFSVAILEKGLLDLHDTGAMLYQLSYKATHWERGQFIEFIFCRAMKWCEVYMR